MRCCVLQHLAFEDLGTFAPILLEAGWTIQACHVADGLPDARDWRDADLCIVLGGPMGVHDGAAYPFLSRELELVRSRLGEGRPLLGICLGAQLMAQALGAAVYAGKAKEIGWGGLQLTEAGAASPLAALRGAPVLHWHGDTFDLKALSCDGIEECRMALLKKSRNALDANFIEGMACIGGCIGGAGCLTHGEKNKADVDKYGKLAMEKTILDAISVTDVGPEAE